MRIYPCPNRRFGSLLAMRYHRPRVALGFPLLLFNLAAAMAVPAAHATAHRDVPDHVVVSHEEHDHVPETGDDAGLTDHDHIVIEAINTQSRPTLDVLPQSQIAVLPLSELASSQSIRFTDLRAPHPPRTHDPPSAPRAPPSR